MSRVIADVIRRRGAGEALSDAQVMADHPELMPALLDELDGLRLVQRAVAAAQRAGTIDTAIRPVPLDEMEAPIVPDDAPEQDFVPEEYMISGYHILCEISTGGQATVYKALQESTGKIVAVKILPGGALAGSRERRRFDREAEILASLDHPNIVAILDRGRTADGSFYFVMPYVRGVPLDEYARTVRRADGRSAATVILKTFVTLARAVAAAHRRGIVHRDLKPSNILVDDGGEPHLLDFGLARPAREGDEAWRVRTITGPGHVVGSLPWLSPEQVSKGTVPVDARSDVYSLGVCLFECLTGRHPYPLDGSMPEVIARIQHHHPDALARGQGGEGLPTSVRAILGRCLAKRSVDRYADAEHLSGDLEIAAAGGTVGESEPSRTPIPTWGRLALSVCLVILVASSGSLHKPTRVPMGTNAVSGLPTTRNTVGMTLIRIPAGPFLMGTPRQWALRGDDERQHEVQVSRPFWMSAHEVTRAQFFAVLPDRRGESPADDLPMTGVSWQDATDYCEALGRREGSRYRLPTEAEWEYACRAGRPAPWAGTGECGDMGWIATNSGGTLHPVGRKQPNEFGLFDMHGNAAEWCFDWYNAVYPLTRVDPLFRDRTGFRVVRGGSYRLECGDCRSAARASAPPDARRRDLGFRVVRIEPGATAPMPG
jgi:formylglycine-generating enzyme required for sulfatase activity/tRNA A-37 threonylcarbamoyl transferase component Bud32